MHADFGSEGMGSEGAKEVETVVGFEHVRARAGAAGEHFHGKGREGGEEHGEEIVEEAPGVRAIEAPDQHCQEDCHASLAVFAEPAEHAAEIAADGGVSSEVGDGAIEGKKEREEDCAEHDGPGPPASVGGARPCPRGGEGCGEGPGEAVRGADRPRETSVIVADHA